MRNKPTQMNESDEIKEILTLISKEMSSGFVSVAARLDDIEKRGERDDALEARVEILEQTVLAATGKIDSIINVIESIVNHGNDQTEEMAPQPETTIINQEEVIKPVDDEYDEEDDEDEEEYEEIDKVDPTIAEAAKLTSKAEAAKLKKAKDDYSKYGPLKRK